MMFNKLISSSSICWSQYCSTGDNGSSRCGSICSFCLLERQQKRYASYYTVHAYIYNATFPEKRTEEKVNTTSPAAAQTVVSAIFPMSVFFCVFVFVFYCRKLRTCQAKRNYSIQPSWMYIMYLLVHLPPQEWKFIHYKTTALILLLACNHVCFLHLLFTLGILNDKLLSLHG